MCQHGNDEQDISYAKFTFQKRAAVRPINDVNEWSSIILVLALMHQISMEQHKPWLESGLPNDNPMAALTTKPMKIFIYFFLKTVKVLGYYETNLKTYRVADILHTSICSIDVVDSMYGGSKAFHGLIKIFKCGSVSLHQYLPSNAATKGSRLHIHFLIVTKKYVPCTGYQMPLLVIFLVDH
jgi:hypothetical protein